jgi:hypothetical protein
MSVVIERDRSWAMVPARAGSAPACLGAKMRSEKKGPEFTVAPLIGAAGAAVAIAIATERAAGKRQTVALGGAAVAFAFSQATSGATRAFFQGAAIAGIGVAIAEWVRSLRQAAVSPAPRPTTVPAAQPEKTTDTSPASDTPAVAEREPSPPPAAQFQPAPDAASEAPAGHRVDSLSTERELAVAPAGALSPEAIEHLSKVNALLAENERRTLSSLNATASIAEVTTLRSELLRRRPADAVAFLRAILRAAHAKLSSDEARAARVRS